MKLDLNLTPFKKRVAVGAAAVVLVAGVVAGREKPALDILQEKTRAVADDGIDLSKLRRQEATLPQNDPFARPVQQQQEKAAPAPRQVAEKPSAPALPFRYFGRLTEKGKTEVFVMHGDELLTVSAGQKIGDYRVDAIAAEAISFTYLPLKTKQTLDLQ